MEIGKRDVYSFEKLVLKPINEGGKTDIDYALSMNVRKSQQSFNCKTNYGGDIDLVGAVEEFTLETTVIAAT